jgi:beta-ureidopropionase / N-carbamoyl-L-amino-acid hydrolase
VIRNDSVGDDPFDPLGHCGHPAVRHLTPRMLCPLRPALPSSTGGSMFVYRRRADVFMPAFQNFVSQQRIWDDLMALAAITDPERPYTRRSFSPRFLEGRSWLVQRFEEAGLAVRLDVAGNLIGRIEGANPNLPAIVAGSHSDSVPSGGRFDGPAGILAALEIVRALRDAGERLRHSFEVIDFLAEEPSEYGVSCVGSRAMAGVLDETMLAARNGAGETLFEAIARIGGQPDHLAEARREDIAGYFELHIEQGIVLESSGVDLGLVTAIVGIARVEIVFEGAADHAGATPMHRRRDAGLAAARLALDVADRARAFAERGRGHFVATMGILTLEPNAANVVPGRARMVFDIRSEADALAQEFLAALDISSQAIAADMHIVRPTFKLLSRTRPTLCDGHLQDMLKQGASMHGLSTMRLASGAGHDAAFLARIAPSAMLFIPCRDGRSHTPEEWAEPAAIAGGALTMLEAVRLLDSNAG